MRVTPRLAGALLLGAMTCGLAAPAYADQEVFRWQDPAIAESSGLVVVDGRFVTVNDSGNSADLYVVDPATGEDVDVVSWAKNQVDVEALAPGPDDSVWVGDIGDNNAVRKRITVTSVPLDGSSPTRYVLRYPGGTPHNAETLMAHPQTGQLFIVTKSPEGGEVFAAPETLDAGRPNALTSVGSVNGLLTDGAFWPDGEHVLLRGYGRAFLYTFPELKILGSWALPSQPQGEAIAVTPDEQIYLSSEGVGTPVWQVDLPEDLAEKMAGESSTSPSTSPSPSESQSAEPSPSDTASPEPDTITDLETADVGGVSLGAVLGVAGIAVGVIGGGVWWWRQRSRGDGR